jgi:TPR repeat protein
VFLLAQSPPQSVAPTSAIDIAELTKNAEAGDPKAQYALGTAYEDGNGLPQNDELAAQWYRKAADQGEAAAQNSLGVLYRLGRGVEKDKQEALRWYQRAAQQGYASGMFNIGAAYYNGDGVPANDEIACAWFLLAQDAGSKAGADAVKRSVSEHSPNWILEIKLRVAIMLETGEGIKADPAAAIARYRELAAGDPKVSRVPEEAHLRMAQMYLGGRGLPRDVNSARQQCEAAANLKSGRGCFCLGMLNERGDLGSPNYTEALRWYRSAVRYGDDRAMLHLGKFYESGQGVKHDDVEALKWFILALNHRQADAKPKVDALTSRLSKKENEKALREAREWNRWQ